MGIQFRKDEIAKSLRFRGIVVESMERTMDDGAELWQMTIYNQATKKFVPAGAVRNVDPSSRGYGASGLRKRLEAWAKVGVDEGQARGFEGYECEFDTVFNDYQGQTSTRIIPTQKIGRVGSGELKALADQLAAERQARQDGTSAAGSGPTVGGPAYAQETIDKLTRVFVGHSLEEAQVAATKMRLPVDILNDVMTGQAASTLIGLGVLDTDDSGKFVSMGA